MLRRILVPLGSTERRSVGRQFRSNLIRSKLEKTLEDAALEAVENPLPIDARRIKKAEFRKQRQGARDVSGIDLVLGLADVPDMKLSDAKPYTPAQDLPDYMKGEVSAAPLSDIDLTADQAEKPEFLNVEKDIPEQIKPSTPPKTHPARKKVDTGKKVEEKKRDVVSKVREVNAGAGRNSRSPTKQKEAVQREVNQDDLPDFLKSSPPSHDAAAEEADLPDFLKTKATEGNAKDDDLPDFLKSSPPSGAKTKAPEMPDDDDLPDFLKSAPSGSTKTKSAAVNDDDDLPDFLKASLPDSKPKRASSAKPAVEDADDEDDLPDFLKSTPSGSTKTKAAAVDADDEDDLPDFLKAPSKKSNSQPNDDDDLPDFLKPKKTAGTASSPPAVEDADDEDGLPDFLKTPAKKSATNDDDLPDFLKPKKTAGTASPPAVEDADDEDDLPDFLKSAPSGSTKTKAAAVDADDEDDLPDFLKAPSKKSNSQPNDDDDLPDFLKPKKTAGTASSPPAVEDADDEDGLPDFLKTPAKKSATNDDDLPDFLKPQTTPGAKTTPPAVEDADDEDDLPDFLKTPSKKSNSQPNDDDDLPDFLKASLPDSKPRASSAKPAVEDADDEDDLPDFLKTPAKKRASNDDDLPDFLKPKNTSNPSSPAVEDADDEDDLPDFLKSAPSGSTKTKAAVSSDDNEDDLPDFLKTPSTTQKTSDDDLPDFLKPKRGTTPSSSTPPTATADADDDLPDFLKTPSKRTTTQNTDDDDLPDFLKTAPSGSTKTKASDADDDDLPDFLKTPSKRATQNDDDDLPDFLKGPPSGAAAPSEGTSSTVVGGVPELLRSAGSPSGPTSSDAPPTASTTPSSPSPPPPTGTLSQKIHPARRRAAKSVNTDSTKVKVETTNDNFDFVKPTPQPPASPTPVRKQSEDELPDFLKSQPTQQTASTTSQADVASRLGNMTPKKASTPAFLREEELRKATPVKEGYSPLKDEGLPDFLKEDLAGVKQAKKVDKSALGDDLPDFLKTAPEEKATTKTDHSDLPDFLKTTPSKPNPSKANDDLPDFLKTSPDADTTQTTSALKDDLKTPTQPSQSDKPMDKALDDDDLPDFLKTTPSKPNPTQADDLPDFLKTDTTQTTSALNEDLTTPTHPSQSDKPMDKALDDDDLPDFLKTDTTQTTSALKDDLKTPTHPSQSDKPMDKALDDDDLPDFLKTNDAKKPKDAPLPEFLQEEPTLKERIPKASAAAKARLPVDDDDDLPDFLKDFAAKKMVDSELPSFLRTVSKTSRPAPQKETPYTPPPYTSDVKGKFAITFGEGSDVRTIRILDALTVEPVEASWQGTRLNVSVSSGKVAFGVKVLSGKLCRIGWSVASTNLDLGSAHGSYGYGATGKKSTNRDFIDYGGEYGAGDTVIALLDVEEATISFVTNGTNHGVAFTLTPSLANASLYPHLLTKDARLRLITGEQKSALPSIPSGYKWLSEAVKSNKTCALCGQGRSTEEMEEMGGGSGFFRCQDGKQNNGCADERLGKRAAPSPGKEAEAKPERVRAPVDGVEFAKRAANSQARSWQTYSSGAKTASSSWRNRASTSGVSKQRCRECWNLVPEKALQTDGKGVFFCDPKKDKPCRDLTDEEKAENSLSRVSNIGGW